MNITLWRNPFRFWHQNTTDFPKEIELKRWAWSAWVEYQAWLFHNSFITLHEWQRQRRETLRWLNCPLISIITPVFNTQVNHLTECIRSVQTQTYPYWEQCLVDDGSHDANTRRCLKAWLTMDSRLRLQRLERNQGICFATNQALAMARGDYIAFLDHDDRLAPEALYHVAKVLRKHRETDFVYSDRDLISPENFRFMHLLKPGWSPENLFASNYTCHLTVYRRSLIEKIGGLDENFEGSQDHDLVLRVAETKPVVHRIPRILYHWRQHEQSVAMCHEAKEYAYQAAQQAIRAALKRRGLIGTVSEIATLWRGNYRVQLTPLPTEQYHVLQLETFTDYAQQINQAFMTYTQIKALVILGPSVKPLDEEAIPELVSWLQIPEVGTVTGKVLDQKQQLYHAGLVQRTTGIPLAIYAGHPENTPGYIAVTAVVRNVSTPHPACCVIKREVWQKLGGLNIAYHGVYALLDFALRALTQQIRVVYTAFARFEAEQWTLPESWSDADRQRFVAQWQTWLAQGDPYYHPSLTLELADMGLNMNWAKFYAQA
jgi:GT2 family glycosyltransferase